MHKSHFMGIHELRPHINDCGCWDFDGFLHVDNHWEFESGMEVHTGMNFSQEGMKEPFEIVEGVEVPRASTATRRPIWCTGPTMARRSV